MLVRREQMRKSRERRAMVRKKNAALVSIISLFGFLRRRWDWREWNGGSAYLN